MAKVQKRQVAVAAVDELPIGKRKLFEVDGKSIGLFNVNGDYVAVLNVCPHELAPVCLGRLGGTTLPTEPGEDLKWGCEGEILSCPWHGWEFDLRTGMGLADKRHLRMYPTTVRDDMVYIEI